MSKPTDGMVIECRPPADLGEVWLSRACGILVVWDTVARRLVVCPCHEIPVSEMRDLASNFGLRLEIGLYDVDEWSVDNGKEGLERVTYWSPGACG